MTINEISLETNADLVSILQIGDATRNNKTLQELIQFILAGWPSTQDDTPESIHSFWNYRDELSIIDGIVLKGTCIIVPETETSNTQTVTLCPSRSRQDMQYGQVNWLLALH